MWVKSLCKISEPYVKQFWGFSKGGKKWNDEMIEEKYQNLCSTDQNFQTFKWEWAEKECILNWQITRMNCIQ